MDSPSVPTPTRKGTLPGQPLAAPNQHGFPQQNQHPQQQQQQQFQWPHATSTPPGGPFYGYPNFPQQPPFGQQGYFPQAADQQQQQQFAQWAFQQMMFNSAQQQQLSAMPGVPDFSGRQRTGSGAGQEYVQFPPGAMMPPHLGFQPSGTPPPHPHPHAGGHAMHPMQYGSIGRGAGADHQGFHPYRRPGGGAGGQPPPPQRSPSAGANEFGAAPQGQYGVAPYGAGTYPAGYPQPQRPYAQNMNGSVTSLQSNGSGSERRRTGSNAGSARTNGSNGGGGGGSASQRGHAHNQGSHPHAHSHSHGSVNTHGRNQSGGSSITATSARPGSDRSVTPPARATTASPVSASVSPTSTTGPSAAGGGGSTMRPAKPSPLSQQSFSNDPSKRLSRDDSMLEAPNHGMPKSGGLKGRLRRALSFSAVSTLEEGDESGKEKLGSRRKAIEKANKANAALQQQQQGGAQASTSTPAQAESIRTTTSKKPSRTASLFNRKLNASTDNISLQSTVSSASVMIRKLGSMGKLARRNSLAGITGLFKDKDKNRGSDGETPKPGKKADMAQASVTHATVEIERGSGSSVGSADEMTGLSPAAKLARQHTLRSNAQAAERAKQQAEAQAQAQAQANTWDRNKNRVEEEDEEEEDEESDDGTYEHPTQMTGGFDDEDMTVRMERATIQDTADEPWAVGIRRSVERNRKPVKGILRNANNFDQEKYLDKENTPAMRQRANSYTNPTQTSGEPGPLARIPSPDPDHIDGLHRSGSPHDAVISSSFSAEFGEFTTPSLSLTEKDATANKQSPFNYNHPVLNSSAPVLSSIGNAPLAQRSATAPGRSRRLTFANNLSVYDTFAPSTYDRRSEPATCNRLTPALAQRIKEELNSYKMEEMEVHASSRAHTHFFV